jgi:thioredoxin-like negative regulator of GroEL
MNPFFVVICVAASFVVANAATEPEATASAMSEALLTLTSSNFSKTTGAGDWLFLFYGNYEGHSMRFMPMFKRLATHLRNLESPVGFARVECVKNAGVCQAFNIYAYPTIKFKSEDGEISEYKGKREIADMKAWLFERNPKRNVQKEKELDERSRAKKESKKSDAKTEL